MTSVERLLRAKRQAVWSIAPEASIYDALKLMVEKDVEVLPVVDDGRLVGLLSDREYVRHLKGQLGQDVRVREIMIENVVSVYPEQSIEACMALMVARHLRHVPVLARGRVIGVISLHDVVTAALARRQAPAMHRPEPFLARYVHN